MAFIFRIILALTSLLLISSINAFASEATPDIIIEQKKGDYALLPCDISIPKTDDGKNDSVQLILWFKDEGSLPIYAVDFRGKPENPKHFQPNKVAATRISFLMKATPAVLMIKDITEEDTGIYRCRVDFRHSRTRNIISNLKVVE